MGHERAELAVQIAAGSPAGPVIWTVTDAEPLERIRKKIEQHVEYEAARLARREENSEPELAALESAIAALEAIGVVTDWTTKKAI